MLDQRLCIKGTVAELDVIAPICNSHSCCKDRYFSVIFQTFSQFFYFRDLNKQQSHHSWSDGSLYLGLETTFTGHKGSCLASDKVEQSSFQRIPLIDVTKIDIFSEYCSFFTDFLLQRLYLQIKFVILSHN